MVLRTVIVITLFIQTIINMTRPVITLYASELGASTLEIGLLTATFAFFPLILAIQAGKIADKLGDRIPILIGVITVIVSMAFPYFFPSMWSLYMSQIFVGIASIFIPVPLQNLLGNSANETNRDHYFSMLGMAVATGALVGPVIGGYITEYFSYSFSFLISMFVGIIPIGFVFFLPSNKRQVIKDSQGPLSSIKLLQNPMLQKALFSSALVLYSKDVFIAYFPLFAKNFNISDSTIGIIIAVQGLAMIVVRVILPKLIEILGREKVLIFSIIIAGITFLLLPIASNSICMALLSCLMGLGLGCGQPLSMTTTYNASPKSRTGEVLGLRITINRLSQLIAPLFFGIIGTWIGIVSVFLVSGAFLVSGTYFIKSVKDHSLIKRNS
ncbi:MFS transporter [Neobacillus niacini]|uniref:MFS transporter n=1 Tax=Neobacillus niacini TaxID=86668 RepID=UPI003000EACA